MIPLNQLPKVIQGWDKLTIEQKLELANAGVNFNSLAQSLNASKGNRMLGEWTTFSGKPLSEGFLNELGSLEETAIRELNILAGQWIQ